MTRSLLAVLLPALGLALLPAGAVGAAESDDVTWTVRTASNEFGEDRTSYDYTLSPGTEVEDALVVANRGDTALDLGFYAADGYTTDSGQFDLAAGDAEPVSIGAWVSGDSDRVTVEPGKTVEVPFALTVPVNATPGDYAGGIVTSLVQPDDTEGINVDRRLGIRIALRVAGDLAPGLTVDDARLDFAGLNPFAFGSARLVYTIRNSGNSVLSADQAAGLTGPFGALPTPAGEIAAVPQLLPGESWDVSVPFDDVAASFWLTASSTVTPVVVEASGSTTTLAPVVVTASGWAVPWVLLLLLVALAAVVVVVVRLRRRARLRQKAREDARVEDAVALALALALAEQMEWSGVS